MTSRTDGGIGRRQRTALWLAVSILVVIGVAIVVRRALQVVPVLLFGYVPSAAPSAAAAAQFAAIDEVFAQYPLLTFVHILPGLLFVLLAPIQFSGTLRARHILWHRRIGLTCLACGLVIGLSALVMSIGMPAIGGLTQAVATMVFGLAFLWALARAWRHVRRGEIAAHREWMIRAFAIGLAVATIRPIVGLFFATSGLSGLTPEQFFGIAFWIGFTLHAAAAEIWIRYTRHLRITA